MLTLLLTLKDRFEYTENILSYFNNKKFKYPILIADGSSPENQEKLKQSIGRYNELKLTLQNYAPDQCFSDYYLKLKSAADSIQTEYTLLIDNDDYFTEDGCQKAIEFLEANNDFIAAGQICQFINHHSNIFFPNLRYNDFISNDTTERLRSYLKAPQTIWGLVSRTAATQHCLDLMYKCDFRYLHLNEFLYNMAMVSKGKVKYLFESPCTYRRMVTSNSSSSVFVGAKLHYNFYYEHFFYTDWQNFIKAIKEEDKDIKEAELQKYWFKGCIRGFQNAESGVSRVKQNDWIRGLYYRFKYPKKWSVDVCEFELANYKNIVAKK